MGEHREKLRLSDGKENTLLQDATPIIVVIIFAVILKLVTCNSSKTGENFSVSTPPYVTTNLTEYTPYNPNKPPYPILIHSTDVTKLPNRYFVLFVPSNESLGNAFKGEMHSNLDIAEFFQTNVLFMPSFDSILFRILAERFSVTNLPCLIEVNDEHVDNRIIGLMEGYQIYNQLLHLYKRE